MGRNAVFYGIFHERNKPHRSDLRLRSALIVSVTKMGMRRFVQPVLLEFYIWLNVIGCRIDGNFVFTGMGIHIFHKLDKVHKSRFGSC